MTLEEANQKAAQLEVMFMETSAKAGHNVKSLFKKIAMELVGMEKESEVAETQNTSAFHPPHASRFSVVDRAAEIDVAAPPSNEVPDAASCNC